MLLRIKPPGLSAFSKITTSYPSGIRSFATVSEAGPAPTQAMRKPFFVRGSLWQQMPNLIAVIGCHSLQTANRDRLAVHSPAAASRLTRTVTRAAQDAGKYVRFAVQ